MPRPNILFMIADDHRASAIACNGDPTVRTPTMDSLARDGASTPCMHIQGGRCGAVCVPTRATINTGRFTHHAVNSSHGIDRWPDIAALKTGAATMPKTFRDAGYRTHLVGKWHNCNASLHAGFAGGENIYLGGMADHFAAALMPFDPTGKYPASSAKIEPEHSTQRFADAAVAFLQQRAGSPADEPFFLYCAFLSPHDPRTAPREFHDHYPPEKIPLPKNFLPEHPFDNGELLVRDEKLVDFPRTPAIVQQHLSDYYAMIEHQDQQMGRILDALTASGHAQNTIVIYTGDHGLAVGSHGLLGKQNLYDHSIRIPFFARGPGVRPGTRFNGLHQNCDVFPTLCDLAQIPIPATVEGESFAPALNGAPDKGRPTVYAAYKDVQAMVKDPRWKLIRYYKNAAGKGENRLQLFDIQSDPHELTDLASRPEHVGEVTRLLKDLDAWQRRAGDPLVGAA